MISLERCLLFRFLDRRHRFQLLGDLVPIEKALRKHSSDHEQRRIENCQHNRVFNDQGSD